MPTQRSAARRPERHAGRREGTRATVPFSLTPRLGAAPSGPITSKLGTWRTAMSSTIHKAQGATVDRGFVLGSEACYREAGYVAMSRARAGTDVYVVTRERSKTGHPASRAPDLGQFVEALSSSRAKTLALEQLSEEAVLDGSPFGRTGGRARSELPERPDVRVKSGRPCAPFAGAREADRRRATAPRPPDGPMPSWVAAEEARLRPSDAYRVVELEEARDDFARISRSFPSNALASSHI